MASARSRCGMVALALVVVALGAWVADVRAADAPASDGARRVWVVRHADAIPMVEGLTDRTRGLTELGKAQAEWLAAEIGKRDGKGPKGLILTSTFERSKATGEILSRGLGWERRDETAFEVREKEKALEVIVRELERADAEKGPLVLVGHVPQLDALLNHLTHPERSLPIRWGEAALFEVKAGADGEVVAKLVERIRMDDGKGEKDKK